MFVDRNQFMIAACGNGGWIDPSGHVIQRVNFGNGNVFFYIEKDYSIQEIEMEEIIKQDCITIPRLFIGFRELAFIKKWRQTLKNEIAKYNLLDFLEDTYPFFYDEKTPVSLQKRGRQVFSRVIWMVEENEYIEDMYNQFEIEESLLEQWCAENKISLIGDKNI